MRDRAKRPQHQRSFSFTIDDETGYRDYAGLLSPAMVSAFGDLMIGAARFCADARVAALARPTPARAVLPFARKRRRHR